MKNLFVLVALLWSFVAHAELDVRKEANRERMSQMRTAEQDAEGTSRAHTALIQADAKIATATRALGEWRDTLNVITQQHVVWTETLERLIGEFSAASTPIDNEDAYNGEVKRIAKFKTGLPRHVELDSGSEQLLAMLMEYVGQALTACSAVARLTADDALPMFDDNKPLYEHLQKSREALLASVDDAENARLLVAAQMQSRARLLATLPTLWDTRVRAMASRVQRKNALGMGEDLDRDMHDLGTVNGFRLSVMTPQRMVRVTRDQLFSPVSALRQQRMMVALIADLHRDTSALQLGPYGQRELTTLYEETQRKHDESMAELMRLTPQDFADYRAKRRAAVRAVDIAASAVPSICAKLADGVDNEDDIISETSYMEFRRSCVSHS